MKSFKMFRKQLLKEKGENLELFRNIPGIAQILDSKDITITGESTFLIKSADRLETKENIKNILNSNNIQIKEVDVNSSLKGFELELNGKKIKLKFKNNGGAQAQASDRTACQETCSLLQIQSMIDNNKILDSDELEIALAQRVKPNIAELYRDSYFESSSEHANLFKQNILPNLKGKYTVKLQSEVKYLYDEAKKVVKRNNSSNDNESHSWDGNDNWNPGDIYAIKDNLDITDLINTNSCSEFDTIFNIKVKNFEIIPISLKISKLGSGHYELITKEGTINAMPKFKGIDSIRFGKKFNDSYINSNDFIIRIGKGTTPAIFFEGSMKGSKARI